MDTATFVNNLNYVFGNMGITKAHVAKMCGVSKATVSMWLSGRRPYRQSIETIAEYFSDLLYLDISAAELMQEEIPELLRRNAVKRVLVQKLVRDLRQMPLENLVQVSEQVQGAGPASRD